MVLARELFPIDGGREFLLVDLIKRLSPHVEIHLAVFPNKSTPESLDSLPYRTLGISSLTILSQPTKLEILGNLISSRGTIQECLFFNKRNLDEIKKITCDLQIKCIYFDMIRLFRYAKKLHSRGGVNIIYDLDDLISDRYVYFLNNNRFLKNPLGSYAKIFNSKFFNFTFKTLTRPILAYEAYAALRREREVSKISKVVLLTSPAEALTYRERVKPKISVLPNFPIIEKATDISQSNNEKEIIWIGNNTVPHNFAALQLIIKEILPRLPEFKLKVAGELSIDSLIPQQANNIEILGYIKSIGEIYKSGSILIAPFLFGTGIKIKLLEALAYDVAVITNKIGFQGIPYERNILFKPIEDIDEMTNIAKRMVTDKFFLSQWIAEQQKTLESNFSCSHEKKILEEALS